MNLFNCDTSFFAVLFAVMFRDYFGKTLDNKEHDDGKFSEMWGLFFGVNFREKPNVKMGKTGGGGLSGMNS
jgi:hypothetical protein